MEPTTFTKNSDALSGKLESSSTPELEFPDGSHFVSKRYPVDVNFFLELCAERLPEVLRRPDFWERRRAERCYAEFDLTAPDQVPISYPSQFIDDLLRRD